MQSLRRCLVVYPAAATAADAASQVALERVMEDPGPIRTGDRKQTVPVSAAFSNTAFLNDIVCVFWP
jgi:hypothetical protein